MTLDISGFEKAVAQLEESLRYLNSDLAQSDTGIRKQFRAATVQAFEFTYEQSFKMIRRQLEQIVPTPSELRHMSFMELIRAASDAGLIRDVPSFRVFKDMRNLTAHTYDEARAEEVISGMDGFLQEMRFLLNELHRRNP